MAVKSPAEFFGFEPGSDRKMIHWNDLLKYYEHLAQNSECVLLNDEGLSTDNNRFISLVISSADNLKRLDEYVRMNEIIASPQGYSESEIEYCINNSKPVCMQVYSIHSNEVGGAQGCPRIVYDLISESHSSARKILDNVIFVMVPCAEPDGEIVFTDWYHKYLGTKYEGCVSPYIRHRLAGHANNRDAYNLNVVESRYLVSLITKYNPQCYQDHHHDCPNADRMSIAPKAGRLNPDYAPLAYREQSYYGAYMARALEGAGRQGVCSGNENYDAYPSNTFEAAAGAHNACNMLTESADALIATPIEIYPHQLVGTSHTEISIQCPSPWHGGVWHLSDIVINQRIASISLLEAMALQPRTALENSYKIAVSQAERGKGEYYILPQKQHDKSVLIRLLELMHFHKVKMFVATEDNDKYRCGDIIVPKGQPKYAVVQMYLANGSVVEQNRFAPYNRPSGANDGFYHCIYKNMGVEVVEASGEMPPVNPFIPQATGEPKFPLGYNENISYRYVSRAISDGKTVYRTENGFDLSGDNPIKRLEVGVFKRSDPNNEEEGYTQNLLEQFEIPHKTVCDKDIREGKPLGVELLIIPGDDPYILKMGDSVPTDVPIEHHKGLGSKGGESLRNFVENGGKLFSFGKATDYVIELFGLPITNKSAGLGRDEYNPCGTTVNIEVDTNDALCCGLPKMLTAFAHNAPALSINTWSWLATSGKWSVPVSYPSENLIFNGNFKGSELLCGKPAVIRIPIGKGEIILSSFSPAYRMQTDCTYKLIFNAIFE